MLIRQLKLPGLFLMVKKEVIFISITKEREDYSSLVRCQTETFGVAVMQTQGNDDKNILVSDLQSHVGFDITSDRGVSIVAGKYDEQGFDDGPLELAFLNSPVGICCRGSSIYVAEHPKEHTGSIRMIQNMKGLGEFQSIWREISAAFGIISRREARKRP